MEGWGVVKQPYSRNNGPLKRGFLLFDCNFESGNLDSVKAVSDYEYDLWIRPDSNCSRYRVWFYFSVSNPKENQRAIFNVVNFSKTKSLYREGMSPLVKSSSRPAWERIPGKNVFYYRSQRHKLNYVLTFVFVFDRPSDVYYFAYSFPYTYTDLQRYLFDLDTKQYPHVRRQLLCRTLHHRRVEMLTITEPINFDAYSGRKRRVIFITARVHPGESPASYTCQGLINFLVGDTPAAVALRAHAVFKIVPMLNPDGVFLGNYRTSFVGYDLNRAWVSPDKVFTPEIYYVKEQLLKCQNEPDCLVDFYIDLHAHSTQMNGFVFCNIKDDQAALQREAVFPRLLHAVAKDFSFPACKFCRDPAKAGTGRRAIVEAMDPAPHCYTLEVSFYCSTDAGNKNAPFTPDSYGALGRNIAEAFILYYNIPCPVLTQAARRLRGNSFSDLAQLHLSLPGTPSIPSTPHG